MRRGKSASRRRASTAVECSLGASTEHWSFGERKSFDFSIVLRPVGATSVGVLRACDPSRLPSAISRSGSPSVCRLSLPIFRAGEPPLSLSCLLDESPRLRSPTNCSRRSRRSRRRSSLKTDICPDIAACITTAPSMPPSPRRPSCRSARRPPPRSARPRSCPSAPRPPKSRFQPRRC
ncbi:hypothetical protein BD626DRAFT_254680 [Schizophyllum amplum]|uniref:Uncharacterized protein n=1 Tax=Schizophyllum amplum TaxID=97359 RepID=A0A550CIC1_9AGAR|nr:hypothetical protein BD626DRAFT_254680 [Auriculariopsis ampla]